jgi:hypothetical protein
VQSNAAGQVVLKLKTPWRDGATHLVLRPNSSEDCSCLPKGSSARLLGETSAAGIRAALEWAL